LLIVSDTSPISGLLILDKLELLEKLYGEVYIPQSVNLELLKIQSKNKEINEFLNSPWVKVISITNIESYQRLRITLDEGESEAITLAIELNADVLLIDELKGRKEALKSGLNIVGLLGILVEAKTRELIPNLRTLLDTLIRNNFWIKPELYKAVLQSVNEV
jgi:predicted nucleic acid-binding protein